ncbi:S8 family serine peptidase [Sutcliffiella halmapala]|uniref:S8 family serine peptidase n=1 Tax=Sutcliffiella halmapala TaxID=79882 RepID=UPI000995A623|nr:S8 family serine peptidase [Sutcliffiella halmapala]
MRIKEKFVKRTAAITLTVGLLVSPFQAYLPTASAQQPTRAEQILQTLTEEQRQALQQLEATQSYGVQGFSEKELKEDKEVSVIVQFNSDPGEVAVLAASMKGKQLKKADARAQVEKEHKQFKEDLQEILPTAKNLKGKALGGNITREFKTAYNGVAMTLPASKVATLMQSEVVQAVYKNAEFTVDPVTIETAIDADPATTPTTVVESISHLKIDKLHEEGITGEGIKIGVLDTGVDYNHPDLKDAYKGGYDFVDNDDDPMEATYEDWKESGSPEFAGSSSYYTSHGTHVSGTIVGQNSGNNSDISVQGVAPGADLYAYRVLGPYGSGTSDGVIAGIERAVEDGMDILNLSLGAGINDPYFPTSTAINYAVLQGVTSVVAAGNAGPNPFTLGSPGSAALALTVGASDVPVAITTFKGSVGSDWHTEIVSIGRSYSDDFSTLEGQTLELVDVGLGAVQDYEGKDVNGKIAFIARGTYTLFEKIVNAKNNGAVAVIMYNNMDGHVPNIGENQDLIPSFSMTQKAGSELLAAIQSGNTSFTFSNEKLGHTEGDTLASFSSRGPVRINNDMKPEVVAPGVNVLSAYPGFMVNKEDPTDYEFAYARLNGTSMATPHVAGIAALLLESNPNLDPAAIKTILMNTSVPLNGDYSVFDVGAGRVSPYEAIHSQMMIQVQDETLIPEEATLINIKEQTGGLSFDSHYGVGEKHIKVTKSIHLTNSSTTNKAFDVVVEENIANGSNSLKANGISIQASKVINATKNKVTKTNIFAMIPKSAKVGVYEGYLTFTNKANASEVYRMPFSVKIGEDGFRDITIANPAYSPQNYHQGPFNYMKLPALYAEMSLNAPMNTIDVVIQDGKTGEDLGFLGTLHSVREDTNMLLNAFNGTYYKFTGDPTQPIASERSITKAGHYKLKFIGESVTGKVITETRDMYIDVDRPTFVSSLDGQSPFIEYKPGQATYPFEIQLLDAETEYMENIGIDLNQSNNAMIYFWNSTFPSSPIYMDKQGKLVEEIAMNESVEALHFRMDGYDAAGNRSGRKGYYFVKEGTPVTYAKSDITEIVTGEKLDLQLVLDNLDEVTEVEWNFVPLFNINYAKHVQAKLTDEFADNATIEVNGTKVKVTFNSPTAVLDHTAIVDVTLTVDADLVVLEGAVEPTATYSTSTSSTKSLLSAGFQLEIQPNFNSIVGNFIPEGFKNANGYAEAKDWTKVGGKVKFSDTDGKAYEINTFNQTGRFEIPRLPLHKDAYTVEFKVPGHFVTKSKQFIGFEHNGKLFGKTYTIPSHDIIAGDVNGDGVIDIYDALEIKEHWGSDNRHADINFDGTVDEKDIKFVEKNYLMVNPSQDNPPTPKDKTNGKTLKDIFNDLGIN